MSRAQIPTAEAAYVGSLLWLDTAAAAEAHAWLAEDDLAVPVLQLVHRLVGELVASGVRPDPVTVYALAVARDEVPGAHHAQVLTGQLLRLYDARATNPASVRWYAVGALEDAARRRTVEMADRLRQAAAGDRDPDELADLARAEQAAVDAIRARRAALLPSEGQLAAA